MDARNNSEMGKGNATRHTPHQIQQLEAFCDMCPNPNDSQKRQLCRELGLDLDQVTFWIQNKRTQRKALNDRVENFALRSENERLDYENMAFSEVLKNAKCPNCDDHPPVGEEERNSNLQKLIRENAQLRGEYERIANEITRRTGEPTAHLPYQAPESLEHMPSLSAENFNGQQSGSSSMGHA